MGVVSRHALVEGSTPSTAEARAKGDVVAYCGRVPVKLRGPWTVGAHVVTNFAASHHLSFSVSRWVGCDTDSHEVLLVAAEFA
eukprot:SAG25_NODE_102_length_15486_cov_22.883278_16_plen_83_part_00